MEKCEGSKCCYKGCGKFLKRCAVGLMLWGFGYIVNSFLTCCPLWSHLGAFYAAKYVMYRMGFGFAAILFGASALHYNCGCCKHGSACCEDKPK